MPTASPDGLLDPTDAAQLLEVARLSIEQGVHTGRAISVRASDYPEGLRPLRATFVTLRRHGELRGCIGELEARLPLVESVARIAFESAFHDPRFAPLAESELAELAIEIAILGPLERMNVRNEEDLLRQLRPGVDGLVIVQGSARGTYLPSVWESLPEARDFVVQLKRKAGLAADYWSPELEISRFEVQKLS